jgi:hypothetical protein
MTYLALFALGGSISSLQEARPDFAWLEGSARFRLVEQSSALTVVFRPSEVGTSEVLQPEYDFSLLVSPRNRVALGLIESWLDEETDYDIETWPGLKQGLEKHRLSARSLFGE